MNGWYSYDQDRDSLDRERATADYIIDSARECEWSCDLCPYYMITVGVCCYGQRPPECRAGRILREEKLI